MRSRSFNVSPDRFRTRRVAGAGPIPISVGSTPTTAQCVSRASGFSPCDLHARVRREEQCRAAVNDAGGIAGGDASILAEGRRQLGQPFHRRVRPQVIVARKELDCPSAT